MMMTTTPENLKKVARTYVRFYNFCNTIKHQTIRLHDELNGFSTVSEVSDLVDVERVLSCDKNLNLSVADMSSFGAGILAIVQDLLEQYKELTGEQLTITDIADDSVDHISTPIGSKHMSEDDALSAIMESLDNVLGGRHEIEEGTGTELMPENYKIGKQADGSFHATHHINVPPAEDGENENAQLRNAIEYCSDEFTNAERDETDGKGKEAKGKKKIKKKEGGEHPHEEEAKKDSGKDSASG